STDGGSASTGSLPHSQYQPPWCRSRRLALSPGTPRSAASSPSVQVSTQSSELGGPARFRPGRPGALGRRLASWPAASTAAHGSSGLVVDPVSTRPTRNRSGSSMILLQEAADGGLAW